MPRYTEDVEREGGQASGAVVRRTPVESGLARQVADKVQNVKGLPKGDAFVPPKMEPNESSAAYSERVRRAREAHNQKKAMK